MVQGQSRTDMITMLVGARATTITNSNLPLQLPGGSPPKNSARRIDTYSVFLNGPNRFGRHSLSNWSPHLKVALHLGPALR